MFYERLFPIVGMILAILLARFPGIILTAPVIGGNLNVDSRSSQVAIKAAPVRAIPQYDIVYVHQPRRGEDEHIVLPEVFHPGGIEPSPDLMLLHPVGQEGLLFATGDSGIMDPFASFNGESVYSSVK